jgi:DNA polymerase delta subunit 3
MLFEFHQKQNQRKPGSVYATYLLAGVRRPDPPNSNAMNGNDGTDVPMSDSPFPSSAVPVQEVTENRIPTTSILLVREGDLEGTQNLNPPGNSMALTKSDGKEKFETLTSIHIHSLAPSEPKDIHVLSSCNRNVFSQYSKEDPLQAWSKYGTIQNPNVQVRGALSFG